MPTNSNIYVSEKNITGLDILANEEEIFKVRSSTVLLILKIIGLLAVAGIILWIFINFDIANKIGLGNYKLWINLIPVLAVGIVVLAVFINWYAITYVLTNKRVQFSYSFFSAYDKSITLDRVHSVKYNKTFLGVIFNYGDIVIKSAATDFELVFDNVSNPKKYLELIKENL